MVRETLKSASARTKRTPVSGRNVLTVDGKEDGYIYRVVNAEGDRIEMFKDAGWELVPSADVRVGDRRVDRVTAEGSFAQVSVGQGMKAFVMRIKKEWYDEDQQVKAKRVDALEESMKKQALSEGNYGKIEISRD